MTFDAKDPSSLTRKAVSIESKEFLESVEHVTRLLVEEKGRVGSMRIIGRLVEVPSVDEAIIVGDLHGDLESLEHILENSDFMEKANGHEEVQLIFLGDYGDRGLYSPEVYYVVLKLKELYPENVVLMRGNHEGPNDLLASPHDLPFHLNRKFRERGSETYLKLRELFNHLYNAVFADGKLILLHGGVPSRASTVDDIAYAHEKHPRERHLEEILWSDPWEGIKGTYASPRGAGRLFGENVTDMLLKMFGAKALIRGHEPSEDGYKTNHGGKVLTIFSRKGPPYYNDHGAYLHIGISHKAEKAKQLLQSIRKF